MYPPSCNLDDSIFAGYWSCDISFRMPIIHDETVCDGSANEKLTRPISDNRNCIVGSRLYKIWCAAYPYRALQCARATGVRLSKM